MKLFHLDVQADRPEGSGVRTWLVIARNAAEAVTLVPEGQKVISVSAQAPCGPSPARVVGWMGPPPPLPGAVSR